MKPTFSPKKLLLLTLLFAIPFLNGIAGAYHNPYSNIPLIQTKEDKTSPSQNNRPKRPLKNSVMSIDVELGMISFDLNSQGESFEISIENEGTGMVYQTTITQENPIIYVNLQKGEYDVIIISDLEEEFTGHFLLM